VIRHFQERMRYGLFVREVPTEKQPFAAPSQFLSSSRRTQPYSIA
jgi:hypothetical protein